MKITRRDFCRLTLLTGIAPVGLGKGIAIAQTRLAPAQRDGAQDKQPVILTFLHTNDPHGHVYLPEEPTGRTRIATLIRQIRAEMPHVLLLDAGDLIHGTPEEKAFEGHPMIDAMNVLQYDVATAGNHEFDFGQRITKAALKRAQFPVLSANILDKTTKQPWGDLKPYIVREVGGVRVAIFGLTTVDTVKIQFPRTLEGIEFADPYPIARELVPRLREHERADIIVFLSHLGYKEDQKMATEVPGIDLILGGHSHTRLAKQIWVNGTLIAQTGCYDRALGRTDVMVERDEQGRASLSINGRDDTWWGQNGVPAPLGKSYPSTPLIEPAKETRYDAAVLATYTPFRQEMTLRRSEVLTTALEPLPAEGAKTGAIALGALLAESVRRKFGVDVGLVPSSAIVEGLPLGQITLGQAADTIGGYTRQHIVTARVTGLELRKFIERAIKPGECAVQVAGLVAIGTNLQVAVQALQDEAFYTVAGAAFVIQEYFLGREGVIILSDDPEAPTTREAIVEMLRGHAPLRNQIV